MTRFKKILVHVDTRVDAHPALDRAVQLALSHGAQVGLLDIIPDFSWGSRFFLGHAEKIVEQVSQDKQRRLAKLKKEVEARGVPAVIALRDGPTSNSLVREAAGHHYDLVIKEAKGKGSRRLGFFGTTATKLMRKCHCPVLLLKPNHEGACHRVVAAVDATTDDAAHAALNEQIISYAQTFCTAETCQLDVIHAWSIYGESMLKEHMKGAEYEAVRHEAKSHAEHKLDDLVMKFGMGIGDEHVQSLHGDAGEIIPPFVKRVNADLLVMGTVGRSGVPGFLMGNTAERILEKVQCSVLAVKPPDLAASLRASA